jgi:hypothetical protein
MSDITEDLDSRILSELRISVDSIIEARRSTGQKYDDLIWRANAHAELAIGIATLQLGGLTRVQRSGKAKVEGSFQARKRMDSKESLAIAQEKLELALAHQQNDLKERALEEARSARDILNILLIEDRRQLLRDRRTRRERV